MFIGLAVGRNKSSVWRNAMIFITGDTHADVRRFNHNNFPEQSEMTKDDYVIVCGDFGLVFSQVESKGEQYWLDWLERKSFTTLFVDGNHENLID